MELCISCNKNEGSLYTFYYGKLEKEFDNFKDITSKSMTVDHIKNYRVEGSQTKPICNVCITRLKIREIIFPFLRLFFFPAAAWGILLLLSAWTKKTDNSIPIIISAIVLLIGLILTLVSLSDLIGAIFAKKKELGERLALGADQKGLVKESRVFWTESEFMELKMKELKNKM
jgi:hypothetical protein